MSETTDNTIEVKNLTRHYGAVKAVRDINFSIRRGEVVGFLGPNGAGKSTTLRILCGLMPATSGSAYLCGIPVASHPEKARAHIGFMPENNPLPEDLRVREYLHFRARLKGIPWKERKAAVEKAMKICDLNHKAQRKVIGTLSKGYRQRVGIADAILAKPDVIIMDEPTIGLDPHQVLGIRQLIDSLRGHMTVIFSSHILSEIELTCDRVIIINQGRIVAQGTAQELRNEFLPTIRYKFLFKGKADRLRAIANEVDKDFNVGHPGPADEDGFCEYTLETPNRKEVGDQLICRLVKEEGCQLRSFNRIEPNLENIFLAATRRSWKLTDDEANLDSSTPEKEPATPS